MQPRAALLFLAGVAAALGAEETVAYGGWLANQVTPTGYITERPLWSGAASERSDCFESAIKFGGALVQWHIGQKWCTVFSGASVSPPGSCGAGGNCIADADYELFLKPTATPSPTDKQEAYRPACGAGCMVATIVLSIFWFIVLVGLAYWFRSEWSCVERHVDIHQQLEDVRRREEQESGEDSFIQDWEDYHAHPHEEHEPEEGWEDVPRFDKYDLEATGETRFKTFAQFLQAPWAARITGRQGTPDAAEEPARTFTNDEMKRAFLRLLTEEERVALEEWQIQEVTNDETPWNEMTSLEKVEHVLIVVGKLVAIFAVLYLFIIALGLMGDAFKAVGGRTSGRTFRDSELIANPVAAIAIGILATVLMQSSSTTTSVVISMAGADLVTVRDAAFLVMGANIGTSVTNTIVSIAHLNSAEEYRRAFAGATFHDMFNWLTVLVFAPLEISSEFLVELAGLSVESMGLEDAEKQGKVDIIKKITKPTGGRIIQVDSKLIEKIAKAQDSEELATLEAQTIIKQSGGHAFREAPISDNAIGGIMIVISLALLCVCLLLLVRLLQSVLKGRIVQWLRWFLNLEFNNCFCRQLGGLDNYLLLLFGTGATICVQSSSVFTSTITPLVGIGVIHIDKLTALTHGANIGTTVTGVLSALTNSNLVIAMQVALEHVYFNALGTFLWFSIWPLRPVPLAMAKFMGRAAHRLIWFPLMYIIVFFLAIPGLVVLVSVPGWRTSVGVLVPLAVIFGFCAAYIYMRRNAADHLPECLRFDTACGKTLPNWLRIERDDTQDQIDLQTLREKEKERNERAKAQAWPFSAVAWGLNLMAFLALVIALPTTQWRRVRYAKDPVGRADWGIGLWDMCTEDFRKDVTYMRSPDAGCTPTAIATFLAGSSLFSQCSSNSSFAQGNRVDKWEVGVYESAWESVYTERECSAAQFTFACQRFPDCSSRSRNDKLCRESNAQWLVRPDEGALDASGASDRYDFSRFRQLTAAAQPTTHGLGDADGTQVVAVAATMPSQPLAGTVFPASTQLLWSSPVPCSTTGRAAGTPCSDAPAGTALTQDPCTGVLTWVAGSPPTSSCTAGSRYLTEPFSPSFRKFIVDSGSVSFNETAWTQMSVSSSVTGTISDYTTVFADSACNSPANVSSAGLILRDAAQLPGGLTVASVADRPGLVVLSQTKTVTAHYVPQGTTTTGSAERAVLPSEWTAEAVAVAASDDGIVFACRKSPAASSSAVVRCAMINATTPTSPVLVAEKLVLQTSTTSRILSASWLTASKVAVLERESSSSSFLRVIDFSTGANIRDLSSSARSVSALELSGQEVEVRLAAAGAAPANSRIAAELSLPGEPGGMVVSSASAVIIAEDNSYGDSAGYARVMTILLAEKLAELDEVSDRHPSCPDSTYALAWEKITSDRADGEACHRISDLCTGGLSDDMDSVAGLAVSGTVLQGLGTTALLLYLFFQSNSVLRHGIGACAVLITLGSVLLLAAWAMVAAMEGNTYSCPFIHDSGAGAVLVTAPLDRMTIQSYSWALCIFAWSCCTLTIPFVIHKAYLSFVTSTSDEGTPSTLPFGSKDEKGTMEEGTKPQQGTPRPE